MAQMTDTTKTGAAKAGAKSADGAAKDAQGAGKAGGTAAPELHGSLPGAKAQDWIRRDAVAISPSYTRSYGAVIERGVRADHNATQLLRECAQRGVVARQVVDKLGAHGGLGIVRLVERQPRNGAAAGRRVGQPFGEQRGLAEPSGRRNECQPGVEAAIEQVAQAGPLDQARPNGRHMQLGCDQRTGHEPAVLSAPRRGIKSGSYPPHRRQRP